MKLKRFEQFNESFSLDNMSKEEQYRYMMGFLDQRGLNPEQDKHTELVSELHVIWNEELEKKYNCDKYSLMKFSTQELENIKKEYEKSKGINESFKIVEPKNELLEKTKKELEEKYLSNEAVQSIEIGKDDRGDFIQFNVHCDTEIHSSGEYNGVRLKYIKICEFNNNTPSENLDDEATLEKYRKIQQEYITEALKSIKW